MNSENKERKEFYEKFSATQSDVISRCNKRRSAAESELTKARELIAGLRADTQSGYLQAVQALQNWANQSAPADKG